MNNHVFDTLVRASAQREELDMSLDMKHLLENTLKNPQVRKRARRLTMRSVALAWVIALLLVTCAYAVANFPSIRDILTSFYGEDNHDVSRIDQVTAQPQSQVYELPDVTVTVTEAVYDGQSLWLTGTVAPKEGANVVILSENYGPQDPFGIDFGYGAEVPAGTLSNAQTAAKTSARLIKTYVGLSGSGMMDSVLNADGTYSFINSDEDLVPVNGQVTDVLTLLQYEVTSEGYEVEDSRVRQEIPLSFPVLNAQIVTPEPTASPLPADRLAGAITVVGDYDGSDAAIAFKQANPNTAVVYGSTPLSANGTDGGFATAQGILDGTLLWDVANLSSAELPRLKELLDAGKIATLTEVPEVVEAVAQMYPKAAALLMVEGQIMALPDGMFVADGMGLDLEVAKELGLATQEPTTFDELLDVLENYIAIPQEQRTGYVSFYQSDIRSVILEDLMQLRESQCYATGVAVTYSTPEIARLLHRAEGVSKLLVAGEKHFVEGNAGIKMLLSNGCVSLQLDAEAERMIPIYADGWVVNPASGNADTALDYALTLMETKAKVVDGSGYFIGTTAGWKNSPQAFAEDIAPYIVPVQPQPYEADETLWRAQDKLKTRYLTGTISAEAMLQGLDELFHQD